MKNKTTLTKFLEAALEDAFDALKTTEQMNQLKTLIDEKMTNLIIVRENTCNENLSLKKEMDELIKEWEKMNK